MKDAEEPQAYQERMIVDKLPLGSRKDRCGRG